MSFALVGPAKAIEDVELKTALDSFGDGAQAQRLEAEFATLIKSGDLDALTRLAEDIQAKDGEFLNILTTILEQKGEGANPDLAAMAVDPQQLALVLGPCHHANIAIRLVGMMIADGAEPAIRNDVIMIDGTELDNLYAESISRCERINKLPRRVPQIGSTCIMTGDYKDDPDLMPSP